jgi:hypothetical protein
LCDGTWDFGLGDLAARIQGGRPKGERGRKGKGKAKEEEEDDDDGDLC